MVWNTKNICKGITKPEHDLECVKEPGKTYKHFNRMINETQHRNNRT
jgi:hypothetical protein